MITKQDLKEVEEYLDSLLGEGQESFHPLQNTELNFEPFAGAESEAALRQNLENAS